MVAIEEIAAPEQAEDALRRKQGQLLEALRVARVAYWEYDVPNDTFIFNNEFYSLLRTTAEREGGYAMSSAQYAKRFVHPGDLAVVRSEIQKALATTDPGYSQQLDHRIIYADGEVGHFNVNIRIEKDAQGRTIKTHGANVDISERKRAEEELRRAVSLLQSTLNSTADGILVVDGAGKIVSFNERFVSLWQIPRDVLDSRDDEAALGFVVSQLKNPDVFLRKVHELYENPDAESFDILEFKDGRVVERYSRPQRLDDVPIGRVWSFRDIMERKRAEEKSAAQQRLLDSLIAAVPDLVYFKDRESSFIRINEAFARRAGLTDIHAALGKTDFEVYGEQHAREAFEDEQQIIRTGQPMINKEEREEWPDGRVTWATSTKLPFFDSSGKIIGIMGISRDITDRKQAEEVLARERNLLRTMFDVLPDYIYLKDEQSRFVLCNNRRAEDNAMPVAYNTLLGKTDADFFPPEQAAQFRQDELAVLAGKALIDKEEILVRPDGSQQIILTTKLPFRDSNGKIVGLVGYGRDVTERKQAEGKLMEASVLLDTMLSNSPDYIYFKDLQSRFVRVSKSLAHSFRISDPIEFKGKTDFDFFPEADARVRYEDEQQIIRTGQPIIDKQEVAVLPDGQKVWGLTAKLPWRDGAGAIIGTFGITRNITAIKEAEDKLDHERQLLRTLIDLLPEIFYVKDMESRFLMANDALAKSFGKDNYSQILGLSDADFFPAEMAAAFRAEEKKVLAGQEMVDNEENVVFPDGRKYTLLTTKVPFRDNQGQICGLVGIGRDFTERKRSEETIANERQLLRTLIDLLPETFHVKDMDSRFLMVNEALAKRFGKDNYSQVLGLSDADFFPPEKAALYRNEEKKVLAGESLVDHEGMARFPDGREYMLQTSKVPFRDVQGRICGLVGIGRDITERKRAEEQLRESERKYRELVEHANSVIIRWTPDGRITFLNEFGQKFFGYSAEEILGRHVIGTIVPETESTNRDLRPLVNQISADPKSFEHTTNENQCRNGERVWVSWTNKAVFDEHGKVKEILSIGSDITEQKKLEEQFRQSQKMEAIGQLSGGVAHDFNNILTVIQGNASLLLNAQLKPDEKSECSMQIIRASERAADLTRQLLMFSRKQVMQLTDLNLNDAVKQMTKMLQRILGEDIALQSNYAPDLPPIHADAGMVEQVLLNLVVNARDAMPEGGRLTIFTGAEMLDEKYAQQNPNAKTGLHVRLTVTDTGCGIAPEVLPRIFEPFFTTKEVGKGTGLGLATVYGIIQQHHGWITVASEIKKGTTFRIYFPALAGAIVSKKSPPIISQFARGTETILMVEDEPPVRLLVNNLLQRCGYNVLQAESGVAALKVWQAHKNEIQLLLTDIIMPDNMTGLELAAQLQADKPGLKIIYTSGYSGEVAGKGVALTEGINFLKKPYQPEKLARILRKNLD